MFAYWEGVVNASTLAKLFKVTISNITKSLSEYRELYPDSLEYNKSLKQYEPTPDFTCHYIDESWQEYAAFLRINSQVYRSDYWGDLAMDFGPLHTGNVDPKIVRVITQAMNKKLSVKVTYYSLTNPTGIERVIHPIALADSGVRWHCRAYDEYRSEFRDFHLGRITVAELNESSEVQHSQDDAWMTMIELKVAPQPSLTEAQKQVIMMDKGREESFTVKVRAAMAEYYIQYHLIDKEVRESNPLVRPLYLQNYHEIKSWLF
ncbi:WYL domain-containing protein [Psychrosphaera sp. 1_MG-2023]|uniref:helix-turn-helix transcriptional regulator n=1 Tax=Psychrosphaera sp. 1_MG-2023 TaxID=3062643 RepID=UPI0026E375C3|nr:WYL domain-containing protein [Psychrosphaera sp. 1_MG-2023]MDO6720789.1 WYL domain-containing protein [Psychrosphaera sp. 1_MG-2023]